MARPVHLLLIPALLLPARAAGQQALSHIPFCSADSAASAFLDQVRFRVAGSDSASVLRERQVGLVPTSADDVELVVDDSICLAASAAYAREDRGGKGPPAPFPVAVVRAGDRMVVRLPASGNRSAAEPRTLVFDLAFRRLGVFGARGP